MDAAAHFQPKSAHFPPLVVCRKAYAIEPARCFGHSGRELSRGRGDADRLERGARPADSRHEWHGLRLAPFPPGDGLEGVFRDERNRHSRCERLQPRPRHRLRAKYPASPGRRAREPAAHHAPVPGHLPLRLRHREHVGGGALGSHQPVGGRGAVRQAESAPSDGESGAVVAERVRLADPRVPRAPREASRASCRARLWPRDLDPSGCSDHGCPARGRRGPRVLHLASNHRRKAIHRRGHLEGGRQRGLPCAQRGWHHPRPS